ncbi:MAG: DUF4418 family protein [Defluviitaleaceae bacterium]|nr:DUF4418 family protein [Defluviitaleaceae bacterium]
MKNNSLASTVVGCIFVALGLVVLIGLFTFAVPCTRLLDSGVATRCFSNALVARGFAVIVMVLGVLIIVFRNSEQWLKGLSIIVFFIGLVLVVGAVATDMCNVRTHTLSVGETPTQDNRHMHRGVLETDENVYVVWTNFDCNTGPFVPFVAYMGAVISVVSALFAFFVNTTVLSVKPSFKTIGSGFVALGALTILGLATFAAPCHDLAGATLLPMFMRCYDVAIHVRGMAAVAVVAGVLMILYSGAVAFHKGLNVSVMLLSVLMIITPLITETCGALTMVCNTGLLTPFVTVMGILMLVASAIIHLYY